MHQKWKVKFPGSRARSRVARLISLQHHIPGVHWQNTSRLSLSHHPRCSYRWSPIKRTVTRTDLAPSLQVVPCTLLTKLTTIHPFVSSTPGQYGVCLRHCYLPWHDKLDFGRPFSPRLATWCISLPCASLLHCRILVMDKISTGSDALGRSKHCSQPCYM